MSASFTPIARSMPVIPSSEAAVARKRKRGMVSSGLDYCPARYGMRGSGAAGADSHYRGCGYQALGDDFLAVA